MGAYPSATCSREYRNEYSEFGGAVDHRFETRSARDTIHWARPRFVGVGTFGSMGPHRSTLVHDEEGYGIGTSTDGMLWSVGLHLNIDWPWLGLDGGARAFDASDAAIGGDAFIPRLGLRLGPQRLYLFYALGRSPMLLADGSFLEGGLGFTLAATQVEIGACAIPGDGGLLRVRREFDPLAVALSLHGKNSENYGMALTLEFRLPSARPWP